MKHTHIDLVFEGYYPTSFNPKGVEAKDVVRVYTATCLRCGLKTTFA